MEIYIVKENDTLEGIANYFNVPASDIIKANDLEYPYNLEKNTPLNIPTTIANIFNYYKVKGGDTLYSIANTYDISLKNLVELNGINDGDYIYPGQTLLVPKEGIKTYITEMGDTIASVSRIFNTDLQELAYNNNNIYLLPDQLVVLRDK